MKRIVCRGTVAVGRPLQDAVRLFTPEGERPWAQGWNPIYAEGENADDTAPGTVFTTRPGDRETVWVVVGGFELGMRYARVTPGHSAGTVTVACHPTSLGESAAEVVYDLTALGPEGEAFLDEFASGYEEFLRTWEEAIAASP